MPFFLNLSNQMSCFENIIGVKKPCSTDNIESLSGYFINDYPGISLQTASNIADEETLTGYNYLKDLVRRAMIRLNNDLLSFINSEYRVNSIKSSNWKSGNYNVPYTIIPAGTAGQQRGVYFAKKNVKCQLYKLHISRVRIYSAYSGQVTLKIADVGAGITYNPTVELVAGEVKEFELNLAIVGNECRVTIDASIPVYSNKPNCGSGCGGTPISEDVTVNGISNGVTQKTECYGIEVDILVKCDISKLACDMASDMIIGQAAYELCGAMFYDEMTKTNRLNYLTIYKGDELKEQAAAGFESYRNYMENAFKGLRTYLVSKDGGCKCIDCSGVQIKSNV